MVTKKIIIGITGASGSLYAHLLLEKLRDLHEPLEEVAVVVWLISVLLDLEHPRLIRMIMIAAITKITNNKTIYLRFISVSLDF